MMHIIMEEMIICILFKKKGVSLLNKDKVKEIIENNKGKIIKFKYNGTRNQTEEFLGVIENTYNAIFTIKIKETNKLKSYSYNDVINKNLQFFI